MCDRQDKINKEEDEKKGDRFDISAYKKGVRVTPMDPLQKITLLKKISQGEVKKRKEDNITN